MTGRLRYLLAAAFVAAFFVMPAAPEPAEAALLKIRTWLLAGDGPFAQAAEDGRVPPLRVDYASASEAPEREAERAADYARAVREWARAQGHVIAEDAEPLHLEIRVGDAGFLAVLRAPGRPEPVEIDRMQVLRHAVPGETSTAYYPDRYSLLPAFLAIVLAILSGRVIPALFLGCLAGAVLTVWNPLGDLPESGAERMWGAAGEGVASVRDGIFEGFLRLGAGLANLLVETIWGTVLTSQFQLEILGFVVFLFMAVGVMTRSGGIQGMVAWVRRFARGPISTQICSWVIGVLIFFDDYSNCIIAGSTMRPLTDKARVSREKLAYIVDSTAAPIAGISIFSTWVAYEVSMFAPQLPEVTRADGAPYTQADGFAVFVATLPFRFYCIFTILMVLLTIVLRREFGPMLTAARRAFRYGKPIADDASPMLRSGLAETEPPSGVPIRGLNALLPLLLLVLGTIALIFVFGWSGLSDADRALPLWQQVPRILGNGESQRALLFASAGAFVLATALAVGQRILTLGDALLSALRSAHSLFFAVVILILAWAIGAVCADLGTAQYLTASFHGAFEPWLLPVGLFAISCLVAFSTGTSYGTMAILLPNVVVLAHTMGESDPDLGGPVLMMLTIGAVLEGSIFGDHCSPISDTTVLSSVATGSDHLHHVRTQAPYAVAVMLIAVVCAYVPVALLGPGTWPLAWAAGCAALVALLLTVGRNPFRTPQDAAAPPGESAELEQPAAAGIAP